MEGLWYPEFSSIVLQKQECVDFDGILLASCKYACAVESLPTAEVAELESGMTTSLDGFPTSCYYLGNLFGAQHIPSSTVRCKVDLSNMPHIVKLCCQDGYRYKLLVVAEPR